MDTDTAYCRDMVERHDRDRFILTLAAAPAAREALWALYAFNHEIAKTREITRDAHAGHLRLAWWRDALDGFYAGGAMPAHDVARALGRAIETHDLKPEDFHDVIDARGFDQDGGLPASLEGLADYADATNTPLVTLAARILHCHAPEGLGTAWGLTGIIRALPYLAQQNRCVLPLPMMHDIGLMPEQFHHLGPSPALSKAVADIAARAEAELARGRSNHAFFQRHARMTALYLRRMEKAGHDPFSPRVCGPVPFLALRILF